MFDPDGYWTPAFAALAVAGWGAHGKLPKKWGFDQDKDEFNFIGHPNQATATYLIGEKLAAGLIRSWARELLSGEMLPIPARCWRIQPALYDVFKDGSQEKPSILMSQVGYRDLLIDSPARIYLNTDELLSCLGLTIVDDDPVEPQTFAEEGVDQVETELSSEVDAAASAEIERQSDGYEPFSAVATRADLEHFGRKPPRAPQRDPSLLSGKTVSEVFSKWSALQPSTGGKPHKLPRKPSGLDYREPDSPLITEALIGIHSGIYKNPMDAARALAGKAVGKGLSASKTTRLVSQITKALKPT
ncbi:hypothetical protein ACELLULO517_27360 [Acidisoma cellulosilytica]|uniref:Uncharacterized protein n=1 Tax=Acidisoma cellulosilyticum TaxID=2802395 RepID=A0A963Z8V4_9PROT|nr:hypothetical protein [Acidisoma cellulosilyticum]MCB8883988.1 hypothetical protein [Acidisoma cellulosilyticum]